MIVFLLIRLFSYAPDICLVGTGLFFLSGICFPLLVVVFLLVYITSFAGSILINGYKRLL